MKKAIIFGATGFIGSYLLKDLLDNPAYDQVTIVVRKDPGVAHPRLKVLKGDLISLPSLKSQLIADDVFIALGTTKKKTPDEQEYYKIDHDYPVLAAKLAKENGATSVFLVSSIGASVNASGFYLKTKGEMERDVTSLGFEHTRIFRPSMLLGERAEHRPMEKLGVVLVALTKPFLVGKWKSFTGIQGSDVAKAMVAAATQEGAAGKVKLYQWGEMQELIRSM